MSAAHVVLRRAIVLAGALIAMSGAACAHARRPGSYRPVGASSWYGDSTDDGVTLLVRLGAEAAKKAVTLTLVDHGYQVAERSSGRLILRTTARQLGADSTLVLSAQIIPVELPELASSIVITATYSVPSQGVRNAPVLRRPGTESPLYERLRTIILALMNSTNRVP